MYAIAFIDRTNVALALPAMGRELHMNPLQAGAASGIFFIGYVLLQFPGGYLASRWSPKKLIGILLIGWGACSTAAGLVHTWRELLVARFLLGVAEGSVWPATLVLLANWFPRAERARANACWMLCLPAAVVFSSPISGWILERWNWRVLLISEGLLPFLCLLVWASQVYDHPRLASWIAREEREYLEGTLRRESEQLEPETRENLFVSLLRPKVLIMFIISFLISSGNYGYLFWLPSALRSSRIVQGHQASDFLIGVLNAVPYVVAAAAMVLISRHSDRHHERARHVAFALGWGGTLLLISALVSQTLPTISYCLLCLVAAGPYGLLGPFWAIPSEILPSVVVGSAIGAINISVLGGALGPTLVGYLNKRTGHFAYAFAVLSLGWLIGACLALLLSPAKDHAIPSDSQ
jgi:MFS family permease